ncbi:MAG: hypothetical protein F4Z31_12465 [Gemmatimonadetes bacterium]|nr:hypothetical protein [Gemmatimonadota bacterium]MYE94516.1 hypothetical protein [Gemmatimonadota bacterium]MYJ10638.1 hypothetical protein [Gemmatimonadota bacterium]
MSDANPATDSLFDEIVSQLADENTPVEAVFREIGRSFASTLEEVDAQLDKALNAPPTEPLRHTPHPRIAYRYRELRSLIKIALIVLGGHYQSVEVIDDALPSTPRATRLSFPVPLDADQGVPKIFANHTR